MTYVHNGAVISNVKPTQEIPQDALILENTDYDDGFVNSGYHEGISGTHIADSSDDSLPRNHRVNNRN